MIDPALTFGKEYSHDADESTAGVGGVFDPQQVIVWDGVGGAADGLDYSTTRPTYTPDDQVDAIANHADGLFRQLREDRAHLIFSHDDRITVYPSGPGGGGSFTGPVVPSAGPVTLASGKVIGGAGELSYERAGVFGPPADLGLWADQTTINAMPEPVDVDGVEVWGPEPGFDGDAGKYSLQIDAFSGSAAGPGTSVWNLSGTPYISHADIAGAVTSLLGAVPPGVSLPLPGAQIDGNQAINLDALMVLDTIGEIDSFDRDPTGGPGDQIIFSIQQIPNPADPDGYYATGSELFVLDASLGPDYLFHGGDLWDQAHAFDEFLVDPNLIDGYGVLDINAIEAVGNFTVPEPSALILLVACFASAATMRYRLG